MRPPTPPPRNPATPAAAATDAPRRPMLPPRPTLPTATEAPDATDSADGHGSAGRGREPLRWHAGRRGVRRDLPPRRGDPGPRSRWRRIVCPRRSGRANIALATTARASMPVDEDLALKCWEENGCDTGTGGELKVGLADGFGGNIARQIFKMEFILQALTYPEIGEIGYTDANLDTQKAISDVRSFAAQDFDIIISYPDAGEALVPAYRAAIEEGAKVITWSSGKVGEPGVDYLTYSGPDVCALGNALGREVQRGAARRRQDRDPARRARQHARPAAGGVHDRDDARQHRTSWPGRATPGAVRLPRGDVGDPRRAPRPRRLLGPLRRCVRRRDAGLRGSQTCRWTGWSRCTSPTTTRSSAPGRTPAAS